MRSVRQLVICELTWCLLSGLFLLVPSVRTIEVHEDVNEGPIGVHLRLNVSTSPSSSTTAAADKRNVNDPPPPPTLPALLNSDNFTTTTFPSNHKQHSGPNIPTIALRPATSSATPEAPTTSTTPPPHASGPLPPATRAPPSAGLSSFRAAGSVAIVNDRSAQHQISGYRKRQLYASAVLQRNSSRFNEQPSSSIDGQFTKEFIPSPEVVPFFHEDNNSPTAVGQVFAQGNFVPTSGGGVVDAPYPTGGLADGDSKWYAGFGHGYTTATGKSQPRPSGVDESPGKWDHKFTWHRHREHNAVQFPQDARTVPVFPSPKGKWKWIPEDDDEAREEPAPVSGQRKPSATPFSSSGGGGVESSGSAGSVEEQQQQQQPYFGKYYLTHPSVKTHPYSFERAPVEAFPSPTTFSSDGGTVSTSGVIVGNSSSETSGDEQNQSNGSTDVKLVGKEGAHLKSVSPWKKIIHVLSAAIPIGLLISALTPQVVYINPNATQPPIQLQTPTPISGAGPTSGGLRQRSLGPEAARMLLAARGLGTDPLALVKLFHKLAALERDVAQPSGEGFDGNNRLLDASNLHRQQQTKLQGCDWKLLCQLARQGMLPGSDALHQTLWNIASETPVETLEQLGLEEVFRIIRSGDCDLLQRTCDQDTRDAQ
uniref:Uncharacterized protein n=1 Tax=Anopheles atroparvus TaxID=41427 RepID=A0A182IPK2_ANOAO